jgi:hypothetical protein
MIARYIKPIMLVSGLLTLTMLYAAIAPQAALASTFGATLEGPAAEVVVRNWGLLIGLIGAMLIYGAFHPPVRSLVLTVAAASKLAFAGLVLWQSPHFTGGSAMIAVGVDLVWVVIFAWYLVAARRAA